MKNKIVRWIKKHLRLARAKGIVLGLSGGVDSAVVAALAKEAAGRGKVLALMLPCHSQGQDLEDALMVSRKLGIKNKILDLSFVYDCLLKILPDAGSLARANLKPRLRMLVLYYFANKMNYLVLGTGNKSELSVGYFTKHGDGAVDLLPIAGLLKKEVRKLAQGLGIPKHIIQKPPTAGLWPGQTDEGEMGMTYAELDDILERIYNKKRQVLPRNKIDKVLGLVKKSEHKRRGPEICRI